jgi:alpha-L-rhamnosidase
MKHPVKIIGACALGCLFSFTAILSTPAADDPLAWPVATRTNHPWTRWWWLGSAVDETNLTRMLTQFHDAGIGGVEICPIYGAKGYESRFIDFLSPHWMEMLAHTTKEGKRLDVGVDMTTGTGWPFGGPNVTTNDASARVNLTNYVVAGGSTLQSPLPQGRLQTLMAFSDAGKQIDLTAKVKNGALDWTAPPGQWKLYAMALDGPVQVVKRAAPGGVGSVLDPFSVPALNRYLSYFDKAFVGFSAPLPRSQFHDSYEYYFASGTPDFFSEFKKRRGYDLRAQLPALFDEGTPEKIAQVKNDYRETLADLHLAYVTDWTKWAHARGMKTRNQAHGGPDNLLDTYAAADIPEMEIYSAYSENQMPMMKIAPSAAHLTGRLLASSESFTWMTTHFNATLSQVKQAADFLFISGVNHIFYHGIPYSPSEAPWPGWQFYAAVNFGPQGGLWHDLPEFNAYATRVQSVLQSGAPANDVLLYLPFNDKWQTGASNLLMTFETSGKWMESEPFYQTGMTLWNRGYAYDEVSDRLLESAKVVHGKIQMPGGSYSVIVVPKCKFMPLPTMQKLVELAHAGATILVQDNLPGDVPGFADYEKRHAEYQKLIGALKFQQFQQVYVGASRLLRLLPETNSISNSLLLSRAIVGRGTIWIGSGLNTMLEVAQVPREAASDLGVRFVRRSHAEGYHYFFANRSDKPVDGWVTLGRVAQSAVILDPRFDDRSGVAALSQTDIATTSATTMVHLQLQPGESCILRTFTDKTITGPAWPYLKPGGEPQNISGTWKVNFVEGGPELPKSFETTTLGSWTAQDDPETKRFAGSAHYTIEFDKPAGAANDWLLDLGNVCDSARVKLNGHEVAALWCAPFKIAVGKWLQPGKNVLEVEITNIAANRVRDLDIRKVNWKYFYDANLASLTQRGGLDASVWPIRDSGLLGPVTLTAMTPIK